MHRQLLGRVLVVVLLFGCNGFEESQEEGPILPLAEARRQAEHARLVFVRASHQVERANDLVERIRLNGPDSAYAQANAQAETAMDQLWEALEQTLDAEHELWRALQHQLGEDTEAFWLAWEEWEARKRAHISEGES